MNIGALRAFHQVASQGSFTAAARALHVTQPAVTAQVKTLESGYGVELFFRRSRGVQLTKMGRALYEMTIRLFAVEEEAASLLEAAVGRQVGSLRVGADGPFHVMELLARFRERYPGIEVEVIIGNSRQLESRVRDLDVDVAMLAAYRADNRLYAWPCGAEPVEVLVAQSHPWAQRSGLSIDELDGQPWIRREAGSATQQAFDVVCDGVGVRPHTVIEIGSREALREAVAYGLGMGVVSRPEVGHDHRVCALAIEGTPVVTEEHLVCLASRRTSGLVSAFMEMAESVSSTP